MEIKGGQSITKDWKTGKSTINFRKVLEKADSSPPEGHTGEGTNEWIHGSWQTNQNKEE